MRQVILVFFLVNLLALGVFNMFTITNTYLDD